MIQYILSQFVSERFNHSSYIKRSYQLHDELIQIYPIGLHSTYEHDAAEQATQTVPHSEEQRVPKVHQVLPWLGRAQETPRINRSVNNLCQIKV